MFFKSKTVTVSRTIAWNSDFPFDKYDRRLCRRRCLDHMLSVINCDTCCGSFCLQAPCMIWIDFQRGCVDWKLRHESLYHSKLVRQVSSASLLSFPTSWCSVETSNSYSLHENQAVQLMNLMSTHRNVLTWSSLMSVALTLFILLMMHSELSVLLTSARLRSSDSVLDFSRVSDLSPTPRMYNHSWSARIVRYDWVVWFSSSKSSSFPRALRGLSRSILRSILAWISADRVSSVSSFNIMLTVCSSEWLVHHSAFPMVRNFESHHWNQLTLVSHSYLRVISWVSVWCTVPYDLDDNMRRLARESHYESAVKDHLRDWKCVERHLSTHDRRCEHCCAPFVRRPLESSDVTDCCTVSSREEAIVSDDDFSFELYLRSRVPLDPSCLLCSRYETGEIADAHDATSSREQTAE